MRWNEHVGNDGNDESDLEYDYSIDENGNHDISDSNDDKNEF